MRVLFLGDIMGRAGRQAVIEHLPALRSKGRFDLIVVNGENATSGAGLNGDHAKAILWGRRGLQHAGDHAFDQKDMLSFIEKEPRIHVR